MVDLESAVLDQAGVVPACPEDQNPEYSERHGNGDAHSLFCDPEQIHGSLESGDSAVLTIMVDQVIGERESLPTRRADRTVLGFPEPGEMFVLGPTM